MNLYRPCDKKVVGVFTVLRRTPSVNRNQRSNLDYCLYWHLPPLFNPDNFFGEMENLFGQIVSVNMLCVSRSVPQHVQGLPGITSPEADWHMPD